MSASLTGVLPIVQTPFHDDDRIDFDTFGRQIAWAFDCGANGIGSGMVTELLRLSSEERRELTEHMVKFAAGRGPVFAGVGAESTTVAVEYARHAEQSGCAAVMAIPPVTVAIASEEVEAYFRAIAGAVEIPVIVQDASGYVGRPIPLDVCARLLDEFGPERILFKPEASPMGPHLSKLRDAAGGRAAIYEGSGGVGLIDSYRRGIRGTMPGMDLLEGIIALWRALEAKDDKAAYQIYFPICALVNLQLQAGLDGFLEIEKYLLVKRGIFKSSRRRGPIGWNLDAETVAEVDRLFDRLQAVL